MLSWKKTIKHQKLYLVPTFFTKNLIIKNDYFHKMRLKYGLDLYRKISNGVHTKPNTMINNISGFGNWYAYWQKLILPYRISAMDEPKKIPPFKNKEDTLACPNCGFPVRHDDKTCLFCRSKLKSNGWRLFYYFLRYFQHILRQRPPKRGKSLRYHQYFKYFAFLVTGIILTLVGSYLFIASMLSSHFSNWIISLFFLFYGICTLKTLFKK